MSGDGKIQNPHLLPHSIGPQLMPWPAKRTWTWTLQILTITNHSTMRKLPKITETKSRYNQPTRHLVTPLYNHFLHNKGLFWHEKAAYQGFSHQQNNQNVFKKKSAKNIQPLFFWHHDLIPTVFLPPKAPPHQHGAAKGRLQLRSLDETPVVAHLGKFWSGDFWKKQANLREKSKEKWKNTTDFWWLLENLKVSTISGKTIDGRSSMKMVVNNSDWDNLR